jgi:hypothetical protein
MKHINKKSRDTNSLSHRETFISHSDWLAGNTYHSNSPSCAASLSRFISLNKVKQRDGDERGPTIVTQQLFNPLQSNPLSCQNNSH